MARWLKTSISAADKAVADTKVRAIVEGLLSDIARRGDAAVREMSVKFDKWDRADYRQLPWTDVFSLDQLNPICPWPDVETARITDAE